MKNLSLFLCLAYFFSSGILLAKDEDPYCWELFDKYREIKYWAEAGVSVTDYHFGSKDSRYLNLTYEEDDRFPIGETSKSIVDHFNKEFVRLIKRNLPFHDTVKGSYERFKSFQKKHKNDPVLYEKFEAHEEARRRSLFGSNPGAVFCYIQVSRKKFPILYEIECSIIAREDLINEGGLEEKNLGFSTLEHIEGELKRAITQQLEKLSKTMKTIRRCSKD